MLLNCCQVLYQKQKVLIGHLLYEKVEKFINKSHYIFIRFFKIENLLSKNIGQGNKNKRWRPRKRLKAAEITKSTFERLKTLTLKRFCCIHLHTIFPIHRESQIVVYKIVCYNRIFLGRLFCIQARESNWGNFE